jgi:hypothetical protein
MMRQFLGGVLFIVGEVSMCVVQIPVGGKVVERYGSIFLSIVLKNLRTGSIATRLRIEMCPCLNSVFRGIIEKCIRLSRACSGKLSIV